MFDKEIEEYEHVRREYQQRIADKMSHRLIIELKDRFEYITALKLIRSEGTDEHLTAFFFKTAISRMKGELMQKHKNSLPIIFF